MKNPNLVLATDKNGKKITIQDLENWIEIGSKTELADFFYDRFYVRYLKPFEFESDEYIKSHKNGFAIMTSCCLFISVDSPREPPQGNSRSRENHSTSGCVLA